MPRTKEQFDQIRTKSKANIIQAALKLFSLKGYHATSTNAIAKEAGVSAGLMYNYYSSKEELLVDIVNSFFESLAASVSKEFDGNRHTPDAGKMIDLLIEQLQINAGKWHLLVSIVFQSDISGKAKSQMDGFYFHQQDMFVLYFTEKCVEHPQDSAKVLSSILHGAFLQAAAAGNMDELMLLRRTVIEKILTNGI